MLRNFLLVAFRNLRKNRLYSFINIAGLSIGIMCSALILLWVADETSFNKFHPKSDRLHQVWVNAEYNGKVNSWRSVPLPTYKAMKDAHSTITNSAVTDWGGNHLISSGQTRLTKKAYWVSEEFLEMFEFPLVFGQPETVLDDPSSIVISKSTALALFGEADPINQIVRVNDQSELKVTGILKDIPANSSFQFDFLMTWKHREQISEWVRDNTDNWGNYSFQIFVELADASKELEAEGAIKPILTENGQDDIQREFFLHPMSRWRLHSSFENGKESGGMNDYVQLFSVIAIFIVVIACINFMNLATARSERRAREVGIRKSIGSNKSELILQFIGESMLFSLIAFGVAYLLTILALPFYNQLVDKELFIDFGSQEFWIFSGVIILFTGLLSGIYPAFYLSSFKPVSTLKGTVSVGRGAGSPRKVLVTLQFGFAILLMIGTVVILRQIDLVKNRELGYNQQNLISVPYNEELERNYDALKTELLQSGLVEGVTRSNSTITNISSNNFLGWPGKPDDLRVIFTTISTDYDYTKTMGVKVLMGRDFSPEFASDSNAIIVNKAALEVMDLDDPIGTELDLWGSKVTLVGVVDDVLMGSVYDQVKPMFMIISPGWISFITVRLSHNQDVSEALAGVKVIFEKHNPAYPFEYSFADEDFQEKFTTINLTRSLAGVFAVLAIIITGLGLFGLASYTAERRTKEIGIRKVLGASVTSLIALMSFEFSKLVLLSFVISAPVGYWLLDRYLDRYPIRTNIEWWIFPVVGAIALAYALVIVTNQALSAAQANPVKSLRSE